MDMKDKDFTRPVTDDDIKKTAESFLVNSKTKRNPDNISKGNKFGDYKRIYDFWQKQENKHKLFTAYEIRDLLGGNGHSLCSRVYEMANKKVNILRYVKKKYITPSVVHWQLELIPELHGVPFEQINGRLSYITANKKTKFEKVGKEIGKMQIEFAMNRHLGVEDRMRIMHDICDILCRMIELNPTTTVQKDQWLTIPGTYKEMEEYIQQLAGGEKATEIVGEVESNEKLWFENEVTKRLKGDNNE